MRNAANLTGQLIQVEGGWCAIAHRGHGLWKSTLPVATPELAWSALDLPVAADASSPDPLLDRAAHLLQQYFAGEPTPFDLPLDLDGLAQVACFSPGLTPKVIGSGPRSSGRLRQSTSGIQRSPEIIGPISQMPVAGP